jgi:hypothetical protein
MCGLWDTETFMVLPVSLLSHAVRRLELDNVNDRINY